MSGKNNPFIPILIRVNMVSMGEDTIENLDHLIRFLKDLENSIRKHRQDFESCHRKLVAATCEEISARTRVREVADRAVGRR